MPLDPLPPPLVPNQSSWAAARASFRRQWLIRGRRKKRGAGGWGQGNAVEKKQRPCCDRAANPCFSPCVLVQLAASPGGTSPSFLQMFRPTSPSVCVKPTFFSPSLCPVCLASNGSVQLRIVSLISCVAFFFRSRFFKGTPLFHPPLASREIRW